MRWLRNILGGGVSAACSYSLAQGVLRWLEVTYNIKPYLWIADVIGAATDPDAVYWASWVIPGAAGLLGLAIWPIFPWLWKAISAQEPASQTLIRVDRDTDLKDAVWYIMERDWHPSRQYDKDNTEDLARDLNDAHFALEELNQHMADGIIQSWAKDSFGGPWKEIPKAYWEYYYFESLNFFIEDNESYRPTQSLPSSADYYPVYSNFRVISAQIESVWPKPAIAERAARWIKQAFRKS